MGNGVDNKFTWIIKNFSSLQTKRIYSDTFVIGGCKWCLRAYPKGDSRDDNSLSLFLQVANSESFPCGWRRHAKYSLTVVNQLSEKLSQRRGPQVWWFDEKAPTVGFRPMLSLSRLHDKHGGFLVNDEVKIVAEVEVLEVGGVLDVLEESEEVIQPLKKVKRQDDEESKYLHKGTIDVNGFQVLPSQVKLVSRIFGKYPDIALEFRAKNQHLRTACLNLLLSVIASLCQPPKELSDEDMVEADNALMYVTDAGFKVDWLKKKLVEVKEKKEEQIRIQELEKKLKDVKLKRSDMEGKLEREKAELVVVRAHPTLVDFI